MVALQKRDTGPAICSLYGFKCGMELDIAMAAPVGLAISLGFKEVVQHLFSRGADDDKPLILSEELEDPDLTPAWQNNAPHMACAYGAWERGYDALERRFLHRLEQPGCGRADPLHYALYDSHWKWLLGPVEWLTELGDDRNQQSESLQPAEALDTACERMDFELALRLLDLGADARKTRSALVACCICPPPSPRTHRAKYRARIQSGSERYKDPDIT